MRSSGVNGAIGRIMWVFAILFALLAVRQLYVQVVEAPKLAGNPHNQRGALLAPYRGDILARDGTVLAHSTQNGRVYPYGPALAQAVGYASARYGTSGLEAAFDNDLAAQPVQSDPVAQVQALIGSGQSGVARGATLITTIDPAIQNVLYSALSNYPRAAGVVLDPRTGEVLALASTPSFNPAKIDAQFATMAADPASPLLDRALAGLYPPGSSFKIVTAAMALDAEVVTPDSTFQDPGYLHVGGFTIHNDQNEVTGYQDLAGAFAQSSNVDFGQIALQLGVDRWFQDSARWRIGEPLEFTLPTERDRLPKKADVSQSILAQLGFGQADLLVTPMRMALVGATIASGGTTPRPYLARSLRASNGRSRSLASNASLATPISSDVAAQVKVLMEACVARGTGTAAQIKGVKVAGKTGTATLATGRPHAWFVAFAPSGAPRVAVAVVVEHAGYGGAISAPIARQVLIAALKRIKT